MTKPMMKVLDIYLETLEEIADMNNTTVLDVVQKVDASYRREIERRSEQKNDD